MEVLRCVQCKGDISVEDNGLIGRCLACGTVYYFKTEKNSRIISLLNQANISRLRGDYDGAILAYQIALKEDETDADAYWGITLSTFGIEYVEDKSGKFIPTCRRTISHSILTDENYLNALRYASPEQAQEFERQAQEIDDLQKAIKQKIKDEQDFDVFLSFKSTDANGNATQDRFIARNIFNELDKRGIRTFFSEVSLKNRLGQDFEPIIYKALYTCKVFILIATNEEYIQSSWVKNEWSRFRDRINDEGIENAAFAVFKDIKTNMLPPIFRNQGIDLAKYPVGGYEIEIADNLETRLKQKKYSSINDKYGEIFQQDNYILEEKVTDLLEKKLVGTRLTFDEKVDRALAYDEIGNREKALKLFDEVIDEYPRKASGWFYKAKLLVDNFNMDVIDFHLNQKLKKEFDFNFSNAFRFAKEEEKQKFEEQSRVFVRNINVLKTIDKNAEELEKNLQAYCEIENSIEKLEETGKPIQAKSKDDLEHLLQKNNMEMKEIRKHISHKSYYTKNVPTSPNFAFSFFNFLGFIIILTTIIGTMINVKKVLDQQGSLSSVVFEFVLLMFVGISPFVIVGILRKYGKLNKVKHYIEEDKIYLIRLKEENARLKKLISDFNNTTNLEKSDLNQQREKLVNDLTLVKKQIAKNYTKVNDMILTYSFASKYLISYEEFAKKEFEQNILDVQEDIEKLIKEKSTLIKSNNLMVKELKDKKPKYFSENYEKLTQKTKQLIDSNKERVEYIETRIKELQLEIKIYTLEKEKTFLNKNFFDDFIPDFKEFDIIEEGTASNIDDINLEDEEISDVFEDTSNPEAEPEKTIQPIIKNTNKVDYVKVNIKLSYKK